MFKLEFPHLSFRCHQVKNELSVEASGILYAYFTPRDISCPQWFQELDDYIRKFASKHGCASVLVIGEEDYVELECLDSEGERVYVERIHAVTYDDLAWLLRAVKKRAEQVLQAAVREVARGLIICSLSLGNDEWDLEYMCDREVYAVVLKADLHIRLGAERRPRQAIEQLVQALRKRGIEVLTYRITSC